MAILENLYPPIIDTSEGTYILNGTCNINYAQESQEASYKILIKAMPVDGSRPTYSFFSTPSSPLQMSELTQDSLISLYTIHESITSAPTDWDSWLNNTDNKALHSEASSAVRFNYFEIAPSITLQPSTDTNPNPVIGRNSKFVFQKSNLATNDFITYFSFKIDGVIEQEWYSLPEGIEFILPFSIVGKNITYTYTFRTFKGYYNISSASQEWSADTETSLTAPQFERKQEVMNISNINSNYVVYKLIDGKEQVIADGENTVTDYFLEGSVDTYYYNNKSTPLATSGSYTVHTVFDDMYLLSKDKTLCIRFNPDITGLKRNVVDTITPTIGGTYPFIRRNGAQKYRTFTINGMISYEAELHNIAAVSSDSLAANTAQSTDNTISSRSLLYDIALLEADSYDARVINERLFRDKVLEFLYTPDIKLFKSSQEGNIFVYISNISLTPEKTLGRAIYSFSCTATEVEPRYDLFKNQED